MSGLWEMDYDEAANHWLEKDKGAVHMEPAALREKIDAFLHAHNTGALATADCRLVRCTPIEYDYVDGCLYLFSEGGLKFKCLKSNKRSGLPSSSPTAGLERSKAYKSRERRRWSSRSARSIRSCWITRRSRPTRSGSFRSL